MYIIKHVFTRKSADTAWPILPTSSGELKAALTALNKARYASPAFKGVQTSFPDDGSAVVEIAFADKASAEAFYADNKAIVDNVVALRGAYVKANGIKVVRTTVEV